MDAPYWTSRHWLLSSRSLSRWSCPHMLASLYKQVFQRVHFIGQLSELSFQCSACPPALGRCCQPMLAAHRALEVSCAAVGPPGSGPVATLHAQRLLPLLLSLPPRHGGLRACIPSRP